MGLDLESRSHRTVNILGKLCTSLSVGGHKALPRETYPTSIEMIAEAFEVRQLQRFASLPEHADLCPDRHGVTLA